MREIPCHLVGMTTLLQTCPKAKTGFCKLEHRKCCLEPSSLAVWDLSGCMVFSMSLKFSKRDLKRCPHADCDPLERALSWTRHSLFKPKWVLAVSVHVEGQTQPPPALATSDLHPVLGCQSLLLLVGFGHLSQDSGCPSVCWRQWCSRVGDQSRGGAARHPGHSQPVRRRYTAWPTVKATSSLGRRD